ncbi:MAG: hypothetical protein HC929_09400 [Leptolyngbyaceae cyanobacterium SM2_5_2]|nr:hypothetical protein [Leptolyngbyaceae cyanobacterium SM2_5_2]
MNSKEFEARYKEQVREILNRLQSAVLVSSQLELAITEIGDAVQGLSQEVEQFLAEQQPDSGSEGSSNGSA